MAMVAFEVAGGTVRLIDVESHGAGRTCTALLAAFLVAAPLNAIVIIAVLRSFLRSHVYNLLLASLCTAAFLDAVLNFTLASVFRGSWTDLYRWVGDSLTGLCRFSTASTQLPMALQVSCLVLLSAHHLAGMSSPAQSSNTSPVKGSGDKRFRWLLVLGWVVSFTSVFPIMFGTVDVRFFQERYSCSPVNVTHGAASLATAVTLLTFAHGLPCLLLLVLWTILLSRVHKERQRLLTLELVALQRAAARSSPVRGMSSSLGFSIPHWSQLWGSGDTAAGHGRRFFILSGVLSGLQLVLVTPGLIYVTTTEFSIPPQLHHHHPIFGTSPHLPPQLRALYTPWFDGIFTWLRIIHTLMVPCIVMVVHEPLRTQICGLFGLCGQHTYSQLNQVQSVSGYLAVRKRARKKRKRSKFQQLFDDRTPILFATTDGLHLRLVIENDTKLCSETVFADLSLKQAGENVKRIIYSPQTPKKSFREELTVYEEDEVTTKTRKGGKSVRFSQRVNEIPESSDSFRSEERVSVRATWIDVGPELLHVSQQGPSKMQQPPPALKVELREDFFGRRERRSSEPMAVSRSRDQRSLEMELANNSFASSSSGSMLLTLSQRMRNRDS